MNEILVNKGTLIPLDGMTLTTYLIYTIIKGWLSKVPVNNWEASRIDILKKSVIYVTSQDRGDGTHVKGMATDISVWSYSDYTQRMEPSAFILIIAGELSAMGLKVFVSTYNYHAHIEPGPQGLYAENLYLNGVKCPPRLFEEAEINRNNPERRVEPLAPEIFNIMILYKAFPSNIDTDFVLAYVHRDKKEYDSYYRKIFPTSSEYIWNVTSMTPKETENYMKKLADIFGITPLTLKIVLGSLLTLFIWKKL